MSTRLQSQLTVRAVTPLISGLRVLGHDPQPLLNAARIDPVLLSDPDARVPAENVFELWKRAVEKTRDECLGFHLAQHAEIGSFDVLFYLLATSPTLGAAYARLARSQRLIHDSTVVELASRDGQTVLKHSRPGGLPVGRHPAEFIITAWVRAGRIATGMNWSPIEVRFAHAGPTKDQDYSRYFGSPVRFSTGENALILPDALLEAPCAGSDPVLAGVLDRYVADRLGPSPSSDNSVDRVRAAIFDQIRAGESTAAGVATRLKVSVRTLNRILSDAGTSYREMIDQVRKELATQYLRDRHLAISETAFLLGFSELSAFYRAFHRWTGQTPAEFRQAPERTANVK